jgi:hypothetical protein
MSKPREEEKTKNAWGNYATHMEEEKEWEVGEELDTGLRRRPLEDFFLAGPFPVPAVVEIGNMRGKVLLVWLLIHHRIAYTKHSRITLPDWSLKAWRISQDAKADALKRLVAGGWIEVKRFPGGYLKVSLTAKSVMKPRVTKKGGKGSAP